MAPSGRKKSKKTKITLEGDDVRMMDHFGVFVVRTRMLAAIGVLPCALPSI